MEKQMNFHNGFPYMMYIKTFSLPINNGKEIEIKY